VPGVARTKVADVRRGSDGETGRRARESIRSTKRRRACEKTDRPGRRRVRPGRACAARGRDGTAGGPVSVGVVISSMVSVSRARFPSAPVSPARAAAPPVEEANQRLGGDESRARRGTGTGVARRASRACVSPRGSRTGHVARHGCRVGLRKAARGGRARGSVSPRRGRQGVFSWKRRKRARSWDSRRYPIGLLSGSTSQALAASLFTKVETLCLRTFPHKSSSTSRSKKASRQPALLHLKTAGAHRRGQISRRRRAAGRSRPHTDPSSTRPPSRCRTTAATSRTTPSTPWPT
jgi:hypothetical protein